MSDIDFQNGFIVGMATRGLTVTRKEVYSPIPLTVNTGYGVEIYNKITIVFNKALNELEAGNASAFTVLGHDSSNEVVEYAVSTVELFSGYTLVLTTDNFSTNRGTLSISYDAAVGNLSGITYLAVQTFSRICAVLGIYEINIGITVPDVPEIPDTTGGTPSAYQEWDAYPDSPLLTADYPYQFIYDTGGSPKLVLSKSQLYISTGGAGITRTNVAVPMKKYSYSGGIWTSVVTLPNETYGYQSYLVESNSDIFTNYTLSGIYFAQTTVSSSPNPNAVSVYVAPVSISETLTVPDAPSITESDLLE